MKPVFKIILPILLAVCTAGAVIIWDVYFKDRMDSVEVVVVKAGQSIDIKEQITLTKLTVERRRREDLLENPVPSLDSIVGKYSKAFIAGNSMVTKDMIDYQDLIPDPKKGESVKPIPEDWLYATASSMRRKDKADIYVFEKDGEVPVGATTAQSSSPNQGTSKLTVSTNGIHLIEKPILENVPVLYARDTSGNEVVTNPDDKNSTSETRLTSSSQIKQLELILNDADFKKLADAIEKYGLKSLYISYK